MKNDEMRSQFCKGDLWVIVLVAVSAVLMWIFFWAAMLKKEGTMAVVYQDGKLIREFSLEEDAEFTVEGVYTSHMIVKNGEVFIGESECPGNDCVHSGAIREAGRSIVCLPNHLEIRIEGTSEVDFVVR